MNDTLRAIRRARDAGDLVDLGRHLVRARARRVHHGRQATFVKFLRGMKVETERAERAMRLYQVVGEERARRLGPARCEAISALPEEDLIRFLAARFPATDRLGNPVERTIEQLSAEQARERVAERLPAPGGDRAPAEVERLSDLLDRALASRYASVEPGRPRRLKGRAVPTVDVRGIDAAALRDTLRDLLRKWPTLAELAGKAAPARARGERRAPARRAAARRSASARASAR